MRGSDPVRHGSRRSDRGDDGVGPSLEQQVEEAAAAHQADAAAAELAMREGNPEAAKGQAEIMEFAAGELGADQAEALRRRGGELSLDDFAALSF